MSPLYYVNHAIAERILLETQLPAAVLDNYAYFRIEKRQRCLKGSLHLPLPPQLVPRMPFDGTQQMRVCDDHSSKRSSVRPMTSRV